jgi:Chaperone of endosialidase
MHNKLFNFGIKWAGRVILIGGTAFCCVSPVLAVDPPPSGFYPEENTALGQDALFNYLTGGIGQNVAIGYNAMFSNTEGSSNTGVGDQALRSNLTGEANVALGYVALYNNTSGSSNVAVGNAALLDNTTADNNTAVGAAAMEDNTTGYYNTALGSRSMNFNTTGSFNTAVGVGTLAFNSIGEQNTALGFSALNKLTTGTSNTALGKLAGVNLTTEKNNIDIGHTGVAGESGTIRIGAKAQRNTYIAGISGVTVAGGVGVMVDQKGHLGTMTSSARYKEAIKPMQNASEALLSLKPVTFRYKKELDGEAIPQFGLVAEEVAKVDPDLVARDEEGKPYSVRYEAVNAMLLNEFLKEHRKVEELEATVAELKATMQKVSARLETNQPGTPQGENR